MIVSAGEVTNASLSIQEYGKAAQGVRHPSIINGEVNLSRNGSASEAHHVSSSL